MAVQPVPTFGCCWYICEAAVLLTYTCLASLCPGLSGSASTRMVKPIWILLKQETVNGSGISWAICKSAPRSRQITTPAPTAQSQFFYRPDALPATQPTASKHWRQAVLLRSNRRNVVFLLFVLQTCAWCRLVIANWNCRGTIPSSFKLETFVNNLSKPNASTFEKLGM